MFAYFRFLQFINRKNKPAAEPKSQPAVTLTIQPDPLARSSTRVCGVLYKVPAVPHISPPPAEDPRSPLSFVSGDPSSPAATTPPPPMAGLGSKALAVVAVLAAVVLSVASAAEAPAPSPVSAAVAASSPFAAALVASAAAFLFAAVRH